MQQVTSRASRRRQRTARRRFAAIGGLVMVAAAAGSVLLMNNGRTPAASRIVPTRATTTTSTTIPPTTTTTVDPGTLPQTMDRPTTTDPQFQASLTNFWHAIVTDDPTPAMPFFFPVSAYLQVKSISNPASDWQQRLVAAYQRDIHSLHASLGAAAATAQLTGIDVPPTEQWMLPGSEYNKLSYWRVEGSQVHYLVNGRAATFAVASMISWRGHWYIVHLARIA